MLSNSSSLLASLGFLEIPPPIRLTDPGCPITSFSEIHFNLTVVLRLSSAASRTFLSSPIHKIRLRSFQQQMEMISHQRPRMNPPPSAGANLSQPSNENLPVINILKNDLPTIAACHDVVASAWVLETKRSSHELL